MADVVCTYHHIFSLMRILFLIKLVEELQAENAKLRYQALLLSYLPDAVVALDPDGKIKFCTVQLERMLGMRSDELVGKSIEAILTPDSHDEIRKFISDLVAVEAKQRADQGQSSSGNSSSEDNVAISRSSGRSGNSFPPLYEVNVRETDTVRNEEYLTSSSGNGASKNESSSDQSNSPSNASRMKHKSSSMTDEDPSLKKKIGFHQSSENSSSVSMAFDSANDSAKLSSSLIQCPTNAKKNQNQVDSHIWSKRAFAPRMEQKQESLSSAESVWQDSQNKQSNESSSDGYAEDQDSSSLSGESTWKKGMCMLVLFRLLYL
jgi:PAS domain S-box-containing protein